MDITTQSEIRTWFKQGLREKASYMLVATDTFDWSDYPVYVNTKEELKEAIQKQEKVMETYDLHADMNEQLNKKRSWVKLP